MEIFMCRIPFLNKLKLLKLKLEMNNLNNKYFATVRSDWEQHNYDETVYFYPIQANDKNIKWGKGKVDFITGINLALSSPNKQKIEIILAYFTKEDVALIKDYVILRGFNTSIIKAD